MLDVNLCFMVSQLRKKFFGPYLVLALKIQVVTDLDRNILKRLFSDGVASYIYFA